MTLPRAHGEALISADIKTVPEDFRVTEVLSFEPGVEGEHLWLFLRKREWNTMDVVQWLAKHAKLPMRSVGYSGLKDRQAVTEQWFSLHLPGKADPEFTDLPAGLEIVHSVRHNKKLQRGTHVANKFVIRLRNIEGDVAALPERLDNVKQQGVPNYFGEQRFGRHGQNFPRAEAWLLGEGEAPRKRATRSMWLSAVRSELFNRVVAERVRQHNWNQAIGGDILQLNGSRALFDAAADERSAERVSSGDVHPTGPLVGKEPKTVTAECAEIEDSVLLSQQALIAALCELDVASARRSLRLFASEMDWQQQEQDWVLTLTLPKGAFATTVLAEIGQIRTVPPVINN